MEVGVACALAVLCRIAYRFIAEGLRPGVNVYSTMNWNEADRTYATNACRPRSDISFVGDDRMDEKEKQRSQSRKSLGKC